MRKVEEAKQSFIEDDTLKYTEGDARKFRFRCNVVLRWEFDYLKPCCIAKLLGNVLMTSLKLDMLKTMILFARHKIEIESKRKNHFARF